MPYRIDYSKRAWQQLRGLAASQQALVTEQVDRQLAHQAAIVTRNRKPLRPNKLATWELRLGELRVFYDVETEPEPAVIIRAIGVKVRNRVFIDNRETDL